MYLERLRLDGRTALVTGGAGGIGLACVEALAEFGARVTIADRDAAAIEEARVLLAGKGYETAGAIMDVTDSARVAQVADAGRSTSWSTMPASRAARRRPRRWRTSTGSMLWTSI